MNGQLMKYGPKGHQVCFISGPPSGCGVIWIGGLTDGILACNYLHPLSEALTSRGIALIQAQLGSSYRQFGVSSLKDDAEDIVQLLRSLKPAYTKVVLMGHSTGCQDICFTVREIVGADRRAAGEADQSSSSTESERSPSLADLNVAGAILQAPVSDREYGATVPSTAKYLRLAEDLIGAGMSEEMLPRDAVFLNSPITAYRYYSLYGKGPGCDDDMFSMDLSDDELQHKLGPMRQLPTLLVWSGRDEYVPNMQGAVQNLQRLAHQMGAGNTATLILEGADHSVTQADECAKMVNAVVEFVARVTA